MMGFVAEDRFVAKESSNLSVVDVHDYHCPMITALVKTSVAYSFSYQLFLTFSFLRD
jgi:hypothetical protein